MLVDYFAGHRFFLAISLIGLSFALSLAVPLAMSDGTGAYKGARRVAAERAISSSKMHFSGIQDLGHLKVRVEAVEAVPQRDRDVCGSTPEAMISDNPDSPRHYLVVVSHRTIFGLVDSLTTNYPCLTVSGDVRHSPGVEQ